MGDYDPQIVKTLMILNQERGSDAVGLYNNKQEFTKKATAAKAWLRTPDPHQFIKASKPTGAVYGHTRAGTRGGNTDGNAHPFHYGDIVGAHNGVITNSPSGKDGYAVDSMWAFHELSKVEPGDYQKALAKMSGWYMLVWRDARNGVTYFLSWNGDLSITKVGGAWYYSSNDQHLHTATGTEPLAKFTSGDVMTWDGKKLKKLAAKFTGHEYKYQNNQAWHRGPNAGYNAQPAVTNTRWDDSYTGEVMRVGPKGVWVGRRKNDLWNLVAIQEGLHDLFPSAPLGEIYRLSNPECLETKADATALTTQTKDAQLTDGEMERKAEEIRRNCEFQGMSPEQTERELEKAGLA